jgi:hypothetical protein
MFQLTKDRSRKQEMDFSLRISQRECLDILKQWESEERILGYLIFTAPALEIAQGIGRIRKVTQTSVRIESDFLLMTRSYWTEIPLAGADYEYRDDYVNAETEMKSLLSIRLSGKLLGFGIFTFRDEATNAFLDAFHARTK